MTALKIEAQEHPAQRSRPSVCMNVIEGNTMLDELREREVEIEGLIIKLQVAHAIASDLRLHLLLAGKITT